MAKKINILGTDYEIIESTDKEMPALKCADGRCSFYAKKIYIETEPFQNADFVEPGDSAEHIKFVKRHEVIHAFNNESGKHTTSANEEWMVNYIATIFPKMLAVFKEVDAL